MGAYFVGTSGFASPTSRASLPAGSGAAPDLLRAYGSRFRAVEMDSVFLRSPSRGTVEGWRQATPEGFGFSVRVPKLITHGDGLREPQRVVHFLDALAPLGERLRCLLFTLPPGLDCEPGLMESVVCALPGGLCTAWEFRNPSWVCPEVSAILTDHGGTPVVVENHDGTFGEFPGTGPCYVRFRKETYSYADVVHWGQLLGDVVRAGRDVFAFFRQSVEAGSYVLAMSELLDEASLSVVSAGR